MSNLNKSNYEKVIIYTEDNKVMAIHTETKLEAIARCHPDDEFDFMTGAKLALERLDEMINPPLYYVKFLDSRWDYLIMGIVEKRLRIGSKQVNELHSKTKFTLEEIKAINPNYLPFAVRVEEDE